MRGCELLWDAERADRVQAMIEGATGEPCPCVQDRRCPLLGGVLGDLLSLAATTAVAAAGAAAAMVSMLAA